MDYQYAALYGPVDAPELDNLPGDKEVLEENGIDFEHIEPGEDERVDALIQDADALAFPSLEEAEAAAEYVFVTDVNTGDVVSGEHSLRAAQY